MLIIESQSPVLSTVELNELKVQMLVTVKLDVKLQCLLYTTVKLDVELHI